MRRSAVRWVRPLTRTLAPWVDGSVRAVAGGDRRAGAGLGIDPGQTWPWTLALTWLPPWPWPHWSVATGSHRPGEKRFGIYFFEIVLKQKLS